MFDKNTAHNKILFDWKNSRPKYRCFANDGILSLKHYENQDPKILFLLKEPNADFLDIAPIKENSKGYGPKGNSGTFWRYMRGYEHVIHIAWRNIEFKIEEILKIKECPNINTAYVNIKKQCDNKPVSNNDEIILYAKMDRDYLLKQIDIIDPDIIYCGGTFNAYKILDSNTNELSYRVHQSNGRILVDFHHLAHREGYSTFVELYNILTSVELNNFRKKTTNNIV